jgi:hypothetical protein
MARYYSIQLFKPGNTSQTPDKVFSSQVNGVDDPNALNVIVDAYVYDFSAAHQQAYLQIWGCRQADMLQASNYTGYTCKIYLGFTAGFPLNNPQQKGLAIVGTVYQCFGNWIGTERTIDFVVTLTGALASDNANISFFWKAGTNLQQALQTTLSNAFPGTKLTFGISPNLVTPNDKAGHYQSLTAFAQALKPWSQAIIQTPGYLGVTMCMTAGGLLILDGTTNPTPIAIQFQDFIGQPTWIGPGPNIIQFVCPMRADLLVGAVVSMPQGLLTSPNLVVTTGAAQPQARQKSGFSGNFRITSVHHVGESRNPDGKAWVTVFSAIQQLASSS